MKYTRRPRIFMHLFIPGSGEFTIHSFIAKNRKFLEKNKIFYPGARQDSFYGTLSHRKLQENIIAESMVDSISYRDMLKQYITACFQEITPFLTIENSNIFSLRMPIYRNLGMMLQRLSAWPALRNCVIRPIFSCAMQEDYIEFQSRYSIFYNNDVSSLAVFKGSACFSYMKSIGDFCDSARRHGFQVEAPAVLWHTGEPGAADAQYLRSFFAACDCALPDEVLRPPAFEELRTYAALRFMELILPPQRPSIFSRLLHLKETSVFNTYGLPSLTSLKTTLRSAEREGAVPMEALSSADLRRQVAEFSRPGNTALASRYPNLAAVMAQPAHYTSSVPGVEQGELSEDTIYALLSYFDRAQGTVLLRRMQAESAFHTIEQRRIRRCLEHKLAPQSRVQHHTVELAPFIAVLTFTRNQKKYIDNTIESVIAQKTDFPVEHIIVDDASSDGTQDIIDDYAVRYPGVRPVFLAEKKEGQNVTALFSRCRSPYVALCDGDDYFTDPYKLQTQVDFMEAHPECGLCFHPVKVVYEDGSGRERTYPPLEEMPRGVRDFYYLADLMRVNFIQTNSVMYRWRFTEGLPDWFVPDLVPGDWYWHLLHAETGKIGFINKVMSVYRRHTASLFYASEISPKANRLKHGLSELRSYDVINKHFKERYAKVLQPLANNVFANFLEHYMETGDNGLLTTASERFPELAKDFFAEVKVVRVPGGGE